MMTSHLPEMPATSYPSDASSSSSTAGPRKTSPLSFGAFVGFGVVAIMTATGRGVGFGVQTQPRDGAAVASAVGLATGRRVVGAAVDGAAVGAT